LKYYIISGEASGDLHASNLMRALKKEETHTDFRFWGGDLMEQIGAPWSNIIVNWHLWGLPRFL